MPFDPVTPARPPRAVPLALALACAALLCACGSSDSNDAPNGVTTGALTIGGVVAQGAAPPAGTVVRVKCLGSSGITTGSGSTVADGSYSVSMAASSLPCVVQADTATPLQSLVPGTGAGSVTAHVTPFTSLMLASLTGVAPGTYFDAYSSASSAVIKAPGVATAQTAVTVLVSGAGISLTGVGDLLTGPLSTPTSSGGANSYDLALGALATRLVSAGTPLATLAATLAAASPAVGGGTAAAPGAGNVTLPPALLLAPAAVNCPALRSGNYRALSFEPSDNTASIAALTTTSTLGIDAVSLTLTLPGRSEVLTANGPCRYLGANGLDDYVVAQSGVLVGRVSGGTAGAFHLVMALPVQVLTLADLAGTWNSLSWMNAGTGLAPAYQIEAGSASFSASGVISAATCFNDSPLLPQSACTPVTGVVPGLHVNAGGGFDLVSNDPNSPGSERWFAFRAGGGEIMIVSLASDGSFAFWTRQRVSSLPAVGTTTVNWNFSLGSANTLSPLVATSNTITTTNPTDGSYTRDQFTVGVTPVDTRPESLQINTARSGYTHRTANLVAAGNTLNVREFVALGLRGTGLTPVYQPGFIAPFTGAAQLVLSVGQ